MNQFDEIKMMELIIWASECGKPEEKLDHDLDDTPGAFPEW